MKKVLYLTLTLVTVFILNSCRADFDFEKAYISYDERLSSYTDAFESVWGKIDKDQSWDFSTLGEEEYTETRAVTGLVTNGSNFSKNPTESITRTENQTTTEPYTINWYVVPTAQGKLLKWMNSNLVEFENNSSKGAPFDLLWQKKKFYIIPIYQGQAMDWDIYMQMPDQYSTNTTAENSDEGIWTKGDLQTKEGGKWKTLGTRTGNGQDYFFDNDKNTIDVDDVRGPVIVVDPTKKDSTYNTRWAGHPFTLYAKIMNQNKYYNKATTPGTIQASNSNQMRLLDVPASVLSATEVHTALKLPSDVVLYQDQIKIIGLEDNNVAGFFDNTTHYRLKSTNAQGTNGTWGNWNGTSDGDYHEYWERSESLVRANAGKHAYYNKGKQTIDGVEVNIPNAGYYYVETLRGTPWVCDHDYNDVVFLVVGLDARSHDEKRYMVEDLGATGSSDIDFNDIVFDIRNNKKSDVLISQTITIRALGGTLHFKLGFTKNGSAISTQKGTISDDDVYWVFDKNAATQDGWTYNSSKAGWGYPLTINKMYNTGNESYVPGTGHAEDDAHGVDDIDYETFICKKEFSNVVGGTEKGCFWNIETNNLVIQMLPNLTETAKDEKIHSGLDGAGDYMIVFPDNGATPAIIAFKTTKHWRYERDGITMSECGKDPSHHYSWFTNDNE